MDYVSDYMPDALDDFVDALRRSYERIVRRPGIGSPRYGRPLDLPGLRFVKCGRFPFLVFYLEHESTTELWRVLHERSDLAAHLTDD